MEVAAAGRGSCGMSLRVEMKPQGCHPRLDRPRRGACPPPPPTGLAQGSRAEATMSRRLRAGAGEANPPQTHHKPPHSICPSPIPPVSAAAVGGSHRGPCRSAPSSIQTRLNAPSIPRRLPHPQSTQPPPKNPRDQHGARHPQGPRAPPLHPEHPRGRAPLQQLPTRAHLC